ncbi:unnamed protein product [Gongylonema pulchrum]|uniref:Uncharacterized protein n=1 Tax=Gongylonema pulchrum TaxID=637853 RepID=A0A183DZI4_9BILA|nr:unnamed protein product [Gongylonema pulchrum]
MELAASFGSGLRQLRAAGRRADGALGSGASYSHSLCGQSVVRCLFHWENQFPCIDGHAELLHASLI